MRRLTKQEIDAIIEALRTMTNESTQMNRSAFTHKPKSLRDEVYFHPIHTKPLWDKVWAAAKSQDWYEPEMSYVGNDGEFFYFQIAGLTTGFARLKIEGATP
jgi:hypothetical protein